MNRWVIFHPTKACVIADDVPCLPVCDHTLQYAVYVVVSLVSHVGVLHNGDGMTSCSSYCVVPPECLARKTSPVLGNISYSKA